MQPPRVQARLGAGQHLHLYPMTTTCVHLCILTQEHAQLKTVALMHDATMGSRRLVFADGEAAQVDTRVVDNVRPWLCSRNRRRGLHGVLSPHTAARVIVSPARCPRPWPPSYSTVAVILRAVAQRDALFLIADRVFLFAYRPRLGLVRLSMPRVMDNRKYSHVSISVFMSQETTPHLGLQ